MTRPMYLAQNARFPSSAYFNVPQVHIVKLLRKNSHSAFKYIGRGGPDSHELFQKHELTTTSLMHKTHVSLKRGSEKVHVSQGIGIG
jgi:hypothetical protein